jgi:transposase
MATFKKYEIGEINPVVLDLGAHLAEEHLCKQIEKFVSELDTSSLESNYKSIGQNALHPKLMLSIIFYGYAVGIRSGRKLAKSCEENIPFIYLSKGYFPKKSAINDFRKDNYLHFSGLFLQVLKKCMDADLADPSLSIVDGSKLESDSSKRQTKTREKYEKWQAYLLQDIASLESTLEKLQSNEDALAVKKTKSKATP